jgi:hypothetical protein
LGRALAEAKRLVHDRFVGGVRCARTVLSLSMRDSIECGSHTKVTVTAIIVSCPSSRNTSVGNFNPCPFHPIRLPNTASAVTRHHLRQLPSRPWLRRRLKRSDGI